MTLWGLLPSQRQTQNIGAAIDKRYIPSSTVGVQPCPDRVPMQYRGILIPPHHVVPSYSPVVLSNILPSHVVIILVVLAYEVLSITLPGDAIDFAWDLARFWKKKTMKGTRRSLFEANEFGGRGWTLERHWRSETLLLCNVFLLPIPQESFCQPCELSWQFLVFTRVIRRPCWYTKEWQNVAQVLHNNRIKFLKDFFAIVLHNNMAAVTSSENRE